MKEYTHVCIDKAGVGLPALLATLNQSGLETAKQRGIVLSPGSVKLQHDIHVFLWDDSAAGVKGRRRIEAAGNCILVRVRWPHLTEPGIIFSGTLAGDGGHAGPPAGVPTNGAWAFKGCIPRKYCYIDGVDSPSLATFEDWRGGKGW